MPSNSDNPQDPQVIEGKVYAVMSYLFILCIIPLIIKKDNDFVLYHGKQGLVIFVAETAVFVAQIVLGAWFRDCGVVLLGSLSLWGIIEVLRGRKVRWPVVSPLAEKITLS